MNVVNGLAEEQYKAGEKVWTNAYAHEFESLRISASLNREMTDPVVLKVLLCLFLSFLCARVCLHRLILHPARWDIKERRLACSL